MITAQIKKHTSTLRGRSFRFYLAFAAILGLGLSLATADAPNPTPVQANLSANRIWMRTD
jgi:hypothetical protein